MSLPLLQKLEDPRNCFAGGGVCPVFTASLDWLMKTWRCLSKTTSFASFLSSFFLAGATFKTTIPRRDEQSSCGSARCLPLDFRVFFVILTGFYMVFYFCMIEVVILSFIIIYWEKLPFSFLLPPSSSSSLFLSTFFTAFIVCVF